MAGSRRKTASSSGRNDVRGNNVAANEEGSVIVADDSSSDSGVEKLRERWELASVLNFLNVFEPVIGSNLKLTAEEIEMGLITPNESNAQLHVVLLKGIPPVSKLLNVSDAWVTLLCKKLSMWWPWVAEGEVPLTVAKGEEIYRYKELDPICRLLMLKALCEIRADQDDTVSYINDALKKGSLVSCFRKDKLGKDRNGNSYWYDGNTKIGYRLFKEVYLSGSRTRMKGKGCLTPLHVSMKWETVATNLEGFHKIVEELSSSKAVAEVEVGKAIAKDAVPLVEKLHKKKQRLLKRKEREEMLLLNGPRNHYAVGVIRSCRSRRPISYTFDEYDRVIDEAIAVTKRSKSAKEQRIEKKLAKYASDGMGTSSQVTSDVKGDSEGSDTETDGLREVRKDCDGENDDHSDGNKDDDNAIASDSGNSGEENNNLGKMKHATTRPIQKPITMGSRWSLRLTGSTNHAIKPRNLGAKNTFKHRPTRNSALDTIVVDSNNEESAEDTNSETSGHENLTVVVDSDNEESAERTKSETPGHGNSAIVADSEEVADSEDVSDS